MDNISTEIIITNSAGTVLKNTDYNFDFLVTPPVSVQTSKSYVMNDAGAVGAGKMFSYAPDMARWKRMYKMEVM